MLNEDVKDYENVSVVKLGGGNFEQGFDIRFFFDELRFSRLVGKSRGVVYFVRFIVILGFSEDF